MKKLLNSVFSVICYGFLMSEYAFYSRLDKILKRVTHFQAFLGTIVFGFIIALFIFVAGLGLTLNN